MPAPVDLPDLELQLGQVVIDALAGQGLSLVSTPILYSAGSIDDCCPKPGQRPRVVVWWDEIASSDECGGPIPVLISIRHLLCWPVPAEPLAVDDRTFTEAAAHMARAAWVGETALRALVCDRARARQMGLSSVSLVSAKPKKPQGGCAGTTWQLRVRPQATDWLRPPSS